MNLHQCHSYTDTPPHCMCVGVSHCPAHASASPMHHATLGSCVYAACCMGQQRVGRRICIATPRSFTVSGASKCPGLLRSELCWMKCSLQHADAIMITRLACQTSSTESD